MQLETKHRNKRHKERVRPFCIPIPPTAWHLRPFSQFLEVSKIRSVILNEGISRCNVFFYLAFIVEGQEEMALGFQVLFICSVATPTRHSLRFPGITAKASASHNNLQ